jgi:hypothetical protein
VQKTRLWTGRSGIPIPAGAMELSLLRNVKTPSRLLFNRCWGLLLSGVKRPEREADHSFPYTAEIKKEFLELYLYSAYMS